MADQIKPDAPAVAVPEGSVVGDENLPEPREVEVDVVEEDQPAQVTGPAAEPVDTVRVHEVSVKLDEVITDPSSPLAVQIPDAGRGSLDLPIHGLAAPTPEAVFAQGSDEPEEKPESEADAANS